MTAIPSDIYAKLTPSERVRAAVSAIARGDDAELKYLSDTCPKKTYRMADAAFGDSMENLKTLSIAVESDLQRMALDFLIASRRGDMKETVNGTLAVMDSVETAWGTLIDEMGLDRAEMAKAFPLRHAAVEVLISLAAGEAHPAIVEAHLSAMRAYLAA